MIERQFLPAPKFLADGNALVRHPAEKGTWIWHPGKSPLQTAILRFRLQVSLAEKIKPLIHITADQRFQFRCDGRDVSFGPDRCDLEHWTAQSFRLELTPGEHELEVLAWWIAPPSGERPTGSSPSEVSPPMAQFTWRGGFLLYTEETVPGLLNTGEAPWMVDDLTGAVEMEQPSIPGYNDVGPGFTFDLDRWVKREGCAPTVVMPPLEPNGWGIRRPFWCLYPAELPEQHREAWTGGRIRAFRRDWDDGSFRGEDTNAPEIAAWQALIARGEPVTVPPHSKWTVLWDLERYSCGYPGVETQGGRGGEVEWSWAEALYEEAGSGEVTDHSFKGNRNQIEGKAFIGIHDRWRIGAASKVDAPSLWWRSGRYVRLRIRTGGEALTLTALGITLTGYPLPETGMWRSSDESWDNLMPLFHHSFRCSAHESWTDSPYYEQMCYVGDNIMHARSNYAWYHDDRLSRRSIRLFEWSRRPSGLVAERYPSRYRQESATYSLLWPMMVRDYAWWRDDAAFVREMLPGVRSVMAEFDGMAHDDGLLHKVPGWPFVDWVPEWKRGCGPGVWEGDSSIVNLHWVLALLATAQVEEAHGDPLLAEYNQRKARDVFGRIVSRYWDGKRGLLLDSRMADAASEHAQTFALLTGLLDAEKTKNCLAALKNGEGLAKASISFTFYLLDALHQHGEEAEFHRRLDFWRALPGQGFTCTPEGPEPSRSDAHAWGAHPAWHTLASIAGIRPAAPGFAKVRIAPIPGPLDHFEAASVHPKGLIDVSFRRGFFTVRLPDEITGDFVWDGQSRALAPGVNTIETTGPFPGNNSPVRKLVPLLLNRCVL